MNHNVIAIDTSTNIISLCIAKYDDDSENTQIIAGTELPTQLQHDISLIEGFRNLCTSANITTHQCDAIILGVGPGSFTGLRVSFAFAKAYAFTQNIPIIGISMFECTQDDVDITCIFAPCTKTRYFYTIAQKNTDPLQPVCANVETIVAEISATIPLHSQIALLGAVEDEQINSAIHRISQNSTRLSISEALLSKGIKKLVSGDHLPIDATPNYMASPITDRQGVKKRPKFKDTR